MTSLLFRPLPRLVGIFLGVALTLAPVFSQDGSPPKMRMTQIAQDIYTMVHPQGSSNSTFVITPQGVLVFDMHILTADQTLAAIRDLTDQRVVYLVSSHASGDHSSGAWHFRQDGPVYVATKNQVRNIFHHQAKEFEERQDSDNPRYATYKGKELIQPDIGFEESLTLRLGGLTFLLQAEGYGHSSGDLTLYIPERRVMLMGDLLNNEIHPGQGETAGVYFSKVQEWIEILDKIMGRNLPVDTYVPGHGPLHIGRGGADLEEQKRYFVVMRDAVSQMIRDGKTLETILNAFQVPSEFSHYRSPGRLKNFLRLFYYQTIERGH